MDQKSAEKIISEYLKPIFGFALKRCRNDRDAEDISQEIAFRAYRALCIRDDIENIGKFIWTIAHNTLSNYYRANARQFIGVSVDELAEILPDGGDDPSSGMIYRETCDRLHREIAYLSKMQRRILIAYYYENKKQTEIARELNIPLGTVKWHLFEAKKELKKGMDTMRRDELKFNPIKFDVCGTSGSIGTKGSNSNFFKSALSQNIAYAVREEALTVNEIADILGVSPVYVESEAEYLWEYGFLTRKGEKYLSNIIIDEPTTELCRMQDELYDKISSVFANELYDELVKSPLLDDETAVSHLEISDVVNGIPVFKRDKNFILWALVPYITAMSGEALFKENVTFEEAATIRPDGGQNLCIATVVHHDVKPPKYHKDLWYGPCWYGDGGVKIWQVDCPWSTERLGDKYVQEIGRVLSLLDVRERDGQLSISKDDLAFLAEKGYIKPFENENGLWICDNCVFLHGEDTVRQLLAIGDRIKEKHYDEFESMKKEYIDTILRATPKHVRKMQEFLMQYVCFSSDGWFILHCLHELVANGKLKLPTEEQRNALTTIVIAE